MKTCRDHMHGCMYACMYAGASIYAGMIMHHIEEGQHDEHLQGVHACMHANIYGIAWKVQKKSTAPSWNVS